MMITEQLKRQFKAARQCERALDEAVSERRTYTTWPVACEWQAKYLRQNGSHGRQYR